MIHYALVSDLLTEAEFEERVEKKSEELGGVVDEIASAMLVVDELGRSHIPIGDISKATTSIVSFYGKILSIEGPREFQRENDSEPGVLVTLILGDPTGTTKTTLWNEQAAIANELSVGDVVQVIGRPRTGRKEVSFVAMRESSVEITETKKPPTEKILENPFVAKVLYVSEVRDFERRGGTASLQTFLVGDESGTARLVTWYPENFEDVYEGMTVSITGVSRKEDDDYVEYSALENTTVTPVDDDVSVLTIDADDVEVGQTPIVMATVVATSDIHTFVNRKNTISRVRNIKIKGKEGEVLAAALWGEEADKLVLEGDEVEIINAKAMPGRFSGLELSVGSTSIIRVIPSDEEPAEISGSVVLRSVGLTIENDDGVWVLLGDNLPEPGMVVTVFGMMQGSRFNVFEVAPCVMDYEGIVSQLSV